MNTALNQLITNVFHWLGLYGHTPLINMLNQLVALALISLLAWIAYLIARNLFIPIIQKIVRRTKNKWDDYVLNKKLLTSFSQLIPAIIVYMCLPVVYSEISHAPEGHLLYTLLFRASAIYVVAIVIKVFCVFLNGVKTASEKNEHAASHYMTALFQVLKIIIWFIGSIIIISILIDKSPIALLAGLGAAATILMLVFKDTIIGLVAGIQLTVNNMVHVGDWIQMDKAGINGIVEEISLTTVKVRNFDNTITTIPPYTLVSETFQNWQGMVESNGRRTVTSLTIDIKSIGYCTDDIKSRLLNAKLAEENDFTKNTVNLTLFRKSMKCFIEKQPTINPSLTVLVRQLTPTSKGLPIEFYFFTKEKEWSTYENQSDEIIEQIIAQLPLFGLRIYQEPSGFDLQNMLLNKDAKLDLKPEKIS